MSVKSIRCLWLGRCLLLVGASASAAADAPLADAAERQDAAAIRALLEQKADVNAPQADGMTALHWAAYHDDVEAVKLLLAAGADAKAANRYGVTPLSLACTNGNTAIVELLLEAGADPNATLPGGETALMTASRTGRLGPVKALLARGADVNARERKGQTALMWAAAEGHVEVVDALLKAGADFRTPLASGFHAAVLRRPRGTHRRRLPAARGRRRCQRNDAARAQGRAPAARPTTPLLLAVENGHFELAVGAARRPAPIPNDRPAGFTALHAITWVRKPIRGDGDPPPHGSGNLSSLDFVRQLVAHRRDLNARLEKGESGRGRFTTTGSTPFLLAARTCDVPLMQLLLELGADPDIAQRRQLHAAAGGGRRRGARRRRRSGRDGRGSGRSGASCCWSSAPTSTPWTTTAKRPCTARPTRAAAKLVQLLADRGADINVWNRKNKWGWTPLMIAQGHRPGNFRPAPDTIAAI